MKQKIITILLVVLVSLNIAVGAFLYFQNKELKNLKAVYAESLLPENVEPAKQLSDEETSKIKKDIQSLQFQSLVDQEKQLMGTVLNVSADSITIKTRLKQLDKLKDADLSDAYTLEFKEADYKVGLDSQTKFEGKELAQLKEGDDVVIESDQSIYGKDTFTASKVVFSEPKPLTELKEE